MEPKRAYKRVLIDEELREIASALRHAECAVSEALSHRKGGPVTERAVQSRKGRSSHGKGGPVTKTRHTAERHT